VNAPRGHRTTLATSLPLRRWLKDDPAWAAQPLAWRAQQTWLAALGSLNQRLSSAALAQQGAGIALQDPVFIVGPWRSGTTVMHELLVAATGCATPRTWQCMDPCAFGLAPRARGAAAVARPMDGLEIRADSPQEDEFALLALGVESAYRAFWMPHRLHQLHHTLDAQWWLDHPQWLDPWENFLRGVLLHSGADATQPLILKSPNHTFRIPSIVKRFPKARFVWMLRDPVQVFHSNRKMWGAMFEAHGVAEESPDALDAFLARSMSACAAALRETLGPADQGRFVVVSHESLVTRPAETVAGVVRQLKLPQAAQHIDLGRALERVRQGRIERYIEAMPHRLAAAGAALASAQRDTPQTTGGPER
jgi:omega-hydroxy-beta-dihydromenaquinone-9 sulfotransferase